MVTDKIDSSQTPKTSQSVKPEKSKNKEATADTTRKDGTITSNTQKRPLMDGGLSTADILKKIDAFCSKYNDFQDEHIWKPLDKFIEKSAHSSPSQAVKAELSKISREIDAFCEKYNDFQDEHIWKPFDMFIEKGAHSRPSQAVKAELSKISREIDVFCSKYNDFQDEHIWKPLDKFIEKAAHSRPSQAIQEKKSKIAHKIDDLSSS